MTGRLPTNSHHRRIPLSVESLSRLWNKKIRLGDPLTCEEQRRDERKGKEPARERKFASCGGAQQSKSQKSESPQKRKHDVAQYVPVSPPPVVDVG